MDWQSILLIVGLAGVPFSSGKKLTCQCECKDLGTDDTYCGDVPLTCEDTKYRSYDGSCNNLDHPWWGTPGTPYKRLFTEPCSCDLLTLDDESLPNPRYVSSKLFVDLELLDRLWTVLFMQYGQIIAHDLSLTSGVAQTKKDAVVCCAKGQLTEAALSDSHCAPISIPEDDAYNAPENKTCMNFNRVETTEDRQCTNPPDIPAALTAVTSYLDVSYIYGSNEDTARDVREFRGGKLKSVTRNGNVVLPQDPTPKLTCDVDTETEPCYVTGDVRVNQNPQLAMLHNVYMEHHNYIAEKLAEVNPHWDDERLYQEARKIEIALHQCLIYKEYLAGLLGTDYIIKNKLYYPNATGYVNDYDPNVNAAPSNEFSAAAFRFYHTQIIGNLRSMKENRNTTNIIKLYEWFDKPSIIEQGRNYGGLLRGLATQRCSAMDRFMPIDILNLLFKEKDDLTNQDLKAIDIQRGRDQRLFSYAQILRELGLSNVQCFEDLNEFIDPAKVKILESVYNGCLENIDLGVGIWLENLIPRTLSTPTSQPILGDQFKRLRTGDRYFFENEGVFTLAQLNEIRKICSISNLLCVNKNIKQMQPEAFKIISESNKLMDCDDFPKFDPLPWKEESN